MLANLIYSHLRRLAELVRVALPGDDVGVVVGLLVEEACDADARVMAALTGEESLLGGPRCLLGHLREASSYLSLLVQFRKIRLLVLGWGTLCILGHVVRRGLVVAAASLLVCESSQGCVSLWLRILAIPRHNYRCVLFCRAHVLLLLPGRHLLVGVNLFGSYIGLSEAVLHRVATGLVL